MPSNSEGDDIGSLERTREMLYSPSAPEQWRAPLSEEGEHTTPHEWEETAVEEAAPVLRQGKRQIRLAGIFFGIAVLFFVMSLGIAGYLFYGGGNAVSVDKVSIDIQGPTTIAGGDTVPLTISITNTNPTVLDNATLEIEFPDGTRDATDVLKTYPRYTEDLGTLAPGATIVRSVKAIVFGGAGQTISLPVTFSYETTGSNAVFQKKFSYTLAVSSTPLSISVDALTETVVGKPITLTLTIRSNAGVSLNNVVLTATSPFGFSLASSSIPSSNGSFVIGSLAPGATKQVMMTGTLSGQNGEQRVFHFTVGTAKSSQDPTLAITYMTQDASVTIAAPFITTSLAINGNSSDTIIIAPGSNQSATLSYTNTLPTTVTNAVVSIAISGSAIDYNSIHTTNGFYNSANHTIIFDQDTDSSLASLAPGASGLGSFIFSTLPAGGPSPTITFSTTVLGSRVGQSNVPEQVAASATKEVKVATSLQLSVWTTYALSPIVSSGPIPPRANETTTYSVIWNVQNAGSAVAGTVVRTTLPTYVTYTGQTAGAGSFAYDSASHTVTWTVGDLPQSATAQGIFQVSITPSTTQRGSTPILTNPISLTGYDRFAGVQVSAGAASPTTNTPRDPGYTQTSGIVQ